MRVLKDIAVKKQVTIVIVTQEDLVSFLTDRKISLEDGTVVSQCCVNVENPLKLIPLYQRKLVLGKGAKDMFTILSEQVLLELRTYYLIYRPKEYLFNGHTPGKPLRSQI